MPKFIQKIKGKFQKIVPALVVAGTSIATTVCHATEGATTSGLSFTFDPAEMFSWANMMLDAMMPVIYITLGISLCFIIVGALKRAFGR